MKPIVLIVPGSIETRTGGYEYDRRMAAGLRARGWTVDVRELDDPNHAHQLLRSIPDNTLVLVDGLAFGAMPDAVEREAARLGFVAVVHMPLAAETGLEPARARELEASERRAVAAARVIVVTGKSTAETMAAYGVAPDRIALVEPGTDRAPLAKGSGDAVATHLLCVATVNPGKGHAVLLRALAGLRRADWRLTCVGSLERSPDTVRQIRMILRDEELDDRVSLPGPVDADGLAAAYDAADLFVLPTLHETYGMVIAEALARGLPIVATGTGAIAELVGDHAGIVVPPGDQQTLAHALESALDPRVREKLAQGARRVRERLASWDDAVTKMESVLERAGA